MCIKLLSRDCHHHSVKCILFCVCLQVFFKRFCLRMFRERGREREGGREPLMCERYIDRLLLTRPQVGTGPPRRHVPQLRIKSVTFQFAGRRSVYGATPARALCLQVVLKAFIDVKWGWLVFKILEVFPKLKFKKYQFVLIASLLDFVSLHSTNNGHNKSLFFSFLSIRSEVIFLHLKLL